MFHEVESTDSPSTGEETSGMSSEGQKAQFALQVSRYLLWIGIGCVLVLVVVWLFMWDYVQILVSAGCILLIVIGAGVYIVLHRRGETRLGYYALLFSILIFLLLDPLFLPDVIPSMGAGHIFLIVMSYLLLGDRVSRWVVGVCIVGFVVDLILVRTVTVAWFPQPSEEMGLAVSTGFSVLTISVVAFIVRMVVRGQDAAYRQARQATIEIERQAAADRERNTWQQTIVEKYVSYMAEVSQGHLTAYLDLSDDARQRDGALMRLGSNLQEMVDNVRRMITQIQSAASDLSSTASEILAATTQQVSGASEQSAAIAETTTTVDELRTIAEQSVVRAQEVAGASQQTVEVSRTGRQAVGETKGSMTQIRARVEGIAENILALSEQTQQIGDIIATVNDIAAQSNMLALNASVEAARAGEYGKGFAVVAVEVRNLAEQSKQATAQVRAILSDIQKATNATVMATEEGTKEVEEGMRLAEQAGAAIEQLAGVIEESAQAAVQMVAGGRQQASGVEQMAVAMQSINQATVQSLSSTRQAEKAAQELNDLARRLMDVVEQYRV